MKGRKPSHTQECDRRNGWAKSAITITENLGRPRYSLEECFITQSRKRSLAACRPLTSCILGCRFTPIVPQSTGRTHGIASQGGHRLHNPCRWEPGTTTQQLHRPKVPRRRSIQKVPAFHRLERYRQCHSTRLRRPDSPTPGGVFSNPIVGFENRIG